VSPMVAVDWLSDDEGPKILSFKKGTEEHILKN